MTDTASDLTDAARAADPNVTGLALLRADREPEPGWTVAERADGLRVRIDTADGEPPNEAAIAAALAYTAPTADDRAKADTLAAIRTAADPASMGNRANSTVIYTWLNDLREEVDELRAHLQLPPRLPRYTEPEILAAIAAATEQGAGEPR